MLSANIRPGMLDEVARQSESGRLRRPTEALEEQVLGSSGVNRMRLLRLGDSAPVPSDSFRVYLVRVAKLVPKSPGSYALGWKAGTRAAIDGARPQDSTAWFAEMADPGTAFQGAWTEHAFLGTDEVRRLSRWPGPANRSRFLQAANGHAERLLAIQREYAAWTKLERLAEEITRLEGELAKAKESGACLLSIGAGLEEPALLQQRGERLALSENAPHRLPRRSTGKSPRLGAA
jgi:hypothetical protein